MVDALGEAELVDAGLETALQEVLDLEGQHVIEPHAGLVEHADTDETANEGVAFEEALGVFLVEGEKLTAQPESAGARGQQLVQLHCSKERPKAALEHRKDRADISVRTGQRDESSTA